MFRKIGDWFRNLMLGRYGYDKLSIHMLVLGLVLMLLGAILGSYFQWASIFTLLSYVFLIWSLFRVCSRNISARQQENSAYLSFFSHLRDREHRYFRCPRCHQSVRVPRGRGKINIHCPKCREQFIKKT